MQQQQPQQSASLPQTTKKRSSKIKIIDPSTNTEVNVKSKDSAPVLPEKTCAGESSDNQVKDSQVKEDFKKKVAAVSSNPYQPQPPVQVPDSVSSFVPPTAASEKLYLPNAVITKPPNYVKSKDSAPVLPEKTSSDSQVKDSQQVAIKPSKSKAPGKLKTIGNSAGTRKYVFDLMVETELTASRIESEPMIPVMSKYLTASEFQWFVDTRCLH